MVLLLVFMQLTRDLFAIAKFLFHLYLLFLTVEDINLQHYLGCLQEFGCLGFDPQILPTIDPLLPTGLPTGLQPDCPRALHTAQSFVLVFRYLFSSRVCGTKLAFSQLLITRK